MTEKTPARPHLIDDDAARRRPQGRFAPRGGGLRPSLTAASHRIPGAVRPGRRNGVQRTKKLTGCVDPVSAVNEQSNPPTDDTTPADINRNGWPTSRRNQWPIPT